MNKTVRIWLIVLTVALLFGIGRGWRSKDVPGDFLRYHRAGRMVVTGVQEHLYDAQYTRGANVYEDEREAELAAAEAEGREPDELDEREFKYLPATAVLLAPFGALHPATANILWSAWNAVLIAIGFLAVWTACSRGASGWWMLVPLVALAHAANDNHNLGQLNPSAIVPATVALVLLCRAPNEAGPARRRADVAAGLLIAFGAVVKFMPVFLLPWLLWKRRFAALGAALIGIVVLAWGLPSVVFGPVQSTELIGDYIDARAHHYTSAQGKDFPGFSIKSFVYRVAGDVPFKRLGSERRAVTLDVSVVSLSPSVIFWLVMLLNALIVVAVFWATWGPYRGAGTARGPPEAGLAMCMLLFISPEARGPHFLYLLLPAAALVYGLLAVPKAERGGWWRALVAASVVGVVLLYGNSTTLFGKMGSAWMSALCSLGWSAAICFVVLVVLRRRLGGDDVGGDEAGGDEQGRALDAGASPRAAAD